MVNFLNLKFIVTFFIILTSYRTFAVDLCKKPWKVAVSDRYPFEVYLEGKPKGLNIDVLNKVAEKLNCKVEYFDLPFARIIYEAKHGNLDIVMGVGKRKEREEFAFYFDPYLNSPSVIVIHKKDYKNFEKFKLTDLTQEKNKSKIAGMIGAVYNKEYESLMSNQVFVNHLVLTSKNAISFKKLIDKDVDAILLSDIAIAKTLINSSDFKNDLLMIPIDKEDYSYFMYSKKSFSEEEAKTINSTLTKFLKEKEAENLMLKYFTKEELKIFK
ncbi:transporter substrate-binding domain-containing protein [Pigmentibacter sp. JX0631]|uniref:substrate-binding periplasmic protein n=1 Tax=Pigmentibacter sp. JX0631 TaxID=2976982 RepID=UPI0024689939|nr:transporter substrate-binding domain-containing protein [Pigmentibacter sp. JX0631]WGL60247.1 transporter substrate-binding domain-containing protein [Pigmentibacter sp. JX0631]